MRVPPLYSLSSLLEFVNRAVLDTLNSYAAYAAKTPYVRDHGAYYLASATSVGGNLLSVRG